MSRKRFERLSVDKMKNTGLNAYVYDFSVDFDVIAVNDNQTFTSI